jgi:capsular exopolysaccharide synthesis family protein
MLDLIIDPIYQIKMLWQHKWEILAVVILAGVLGAAATYAVDPVYRATATLMINPQGSNVAPIEDVYEPKGPASQYVLTNHEVLKSRELTGRVVDLLDLTNHKEFFRKANVENGAESTTRLDNLIAKLPFVARWINQPREGVAKVANDPREQAISNLQRVISIESVPFTFVVKIHVDIRDQELSARIANTLLNSYIEYVSGERVGLTEQASGWLNNRLTELKQNLNESEKRLQEFYETEKLVNVGGARGLLTDEYSDNSERLRDARRKREELTSINNKVVAANGNMELLQQIAYIQGNDLVQLAQRLYLEAGEKVSELESRYGEKHPKMISARARLKEARDSYEKQIRQAGEAVKSEYQFSLNTEKSLSGILAKSRGQLEKLDRKQHTLEALQHEVSSNRQLFDSFMQRYKETDIAEKLDNTNNRIIDLAIRPLKAHSPNRPIWVVSAMILGFLFAYVMTFIRALLDDTIKSADAMESLCNTPVLAVLPRMKSLSNKAEKVARLEIDEPTSAYAEAIRTLRTSVMLADASAKKKIVLIASSVPAEGKTCVAANLAIAFSQVERTLLIDCDLRKPSSARYLQIPANHYGFVELLSGKATISEATKRFESANLDVLSCLKPPPNPSELLGSERFHNLLEELAEIYDRIIIDSPPCQVVSDALLLAGSTDAVIFVAKAESTYRRAVVEAVDRLRGANASVLGSVLNQIELRKTAQYGVYYYPDYYGSQGKA